MIYIKLKVCSSTKCHINTELSDGERFLLLQTRRMKTGGIVTHAEWQLVFFLSTVWWCQENWLRTVVSSVLHQHTEPLIGTSVIDVWVCVWSGERGDIIKHFKHRIGRETVYKGTPRLCACTDIKLMDIKDGFKVEHSVACCFFLFRDSNSFSVSISHLGCCKRNSTNWRNCCVKHDLTFLTG